MAGTQGYINPAFPGGSFSAPTPPVGVRAELFTHRATGNYYNWTVPAGVTYIKATLQGGNSDGTTAGGTTSLGQYATATGGGTAGATGNFSVTTTRFPQNVGVSFDSNLFQVTGADKGGQGTVFLENMVPGTTIRITIGAQGGTSGNGVVLLEY